ncbi:efflux RND transporter periplasmic adaptor subunit [Siphonobacter sp. SORGH_AS_1065]|uniref:efflux RND transporter periplasmic adaptor subunit n=1 Tax=Siphonobacter sp. SORGH_AS_1065 TaxID=3041795 RepID=UPI0027812291|nr:efflux RND transporter periplasmic adaptor subunit [Siphonobacter sp. SORGH_AS_1065]MDQ1089794.1 cobalt-zinc-cadmium efflux system membrane fusion protein [Siphonobacter sp. SORGH_AS_1065]
MKKLLFLGWITLLGCQSEHKNSEKQDSLVKPDRTASVITTALIPIPVAMVKQAGIETGVVDEISLAETIQANGIIQAPPQYIATISAPLGGFVKKMNLLQGSFVRQGQAVVELEHPDYIKLQQEYLQALSRIDFLGKELERQTELEKENVGARRKLEQSDSDYKATQALVTSLEAQLRLLGINPKSVRQGSILSTIQLRAPFSGYVQAINVNIGRHVNANEALMEIVNKQHLHVALNVFEKDIAKVKEGQLIHFALTQGNTEEQTARIELVAQTFDGDTKTVKVQGHLLANSASMVPGAYVRAQIVTDQKKVPALPNEAIIRDGSKSFVYRLEKKDQQYYYFKKIPVKIGTSEKGYTEIILETPSPLPLVKKGSYFISAELAKAEG